MQDNDIIRQLREGATGDRIRAMEELPPTSGTEVIAAVAESVDDTDRDVQVTAVETLARIGDISVLKHLLRALRSDHPETQMRAAEALGKYAVDEAIDGLVDMLTSASDDLARIAAIQSLGQLGARRAASALELLLDADDNLVRGYSALALSDIGVAEYIHPIQRKLEREECEHTRLLLEVSLFRLGQESRLEPVLSHLESDDYLVRCATANFLTQMACVESSNIILDHLLAASEREDTVAALSSIKNALEEVKRMQAQA